MGCFEPAVPSVGMQACTALNAGSLARFRFACHGHGIPQVTATQVYQRALWCGTTEDLAL